MGYSDDATSPTSKSLAGDIVHATRSTHTKTNKLVTSRLPLALPPRASDAGPYISGLLHLLPIYMTFEKLWLDILDTSSAGQDERPHVSPRVLEILKAIYIPQLFRTQRLRTDIKHMTGWSDETLDRQVHSIKGTGQLSAFLSHVKQTVRAKPHALIAYSYNLFMALFAGGRFIRASFQNVSEEFWQTVPAPIKPTMQPCEPGSVEGAKRSVSLEFWSFDSDHDGEDLKQEYKGKLLQWESELTAEERDDVTQESIIVLESVGLLVVQLDTVFNSEQDEKPNSPIPTRPSLAGLFGRVEFGARLRDSLLIARERGVGNPFRRHFLDAAEAEKRDRNSENGGDDDDAAAGAELCPGLPRSMRFAKPLPVPPRDHGRVTSSSSKLRVRSQKNSFSTTIVRPVLVGVFGLVVLYVWFTRVKALLG
ncbi:hypothetical protein TARUN_5448 [Trichoderma arundinaceum]|uniref:Heme oxygenase n=1 Tax=Trichoderma arundinaceum TaxID=490622 RepID=A0A395NLQ7_TRIAR|nr:hypothetical protein TARUN_5448 [Trichoderma arundinaceum]